MSVIDDLVQSKQSMPVGSSAGTFPCLQLATHTAVETR